MYFIAAELGIHGDSAASGDDNRARRMISPSFAGALGPEVAYSAEDVRRERFGFGRSLGSPRLRTGLRLWFGRYFFQVVDLTADEQVAPALTQSVHGR